MGILGLIDRRVKPWFGRTKWYARLRESKQMIEGQGGKRKDNIIRFDFRLDSRTGLVP
jgi:hypothetical protein